MASLGPSAPSAPAIGAELAVARDRAGRGLDEFATRLCIRRGFLEALEDGRVTDLPGGAYPVAFLRSYATALGLDADEAVRRFKAEAAELDRPAELAFPAPLPRQGRPVGAILLLGLGLAVAVYAGWYRLSGEGRLPAEAVQPVPAKLARLIAPAPRHASAPAVTAAPPRGSLGTPASDGTEGTSAQVASAAPAPPVHAASAAPPSPGAASSAPASPSLASAAVASAAVVPPAPAASGAAMQTAAAVSPGSAAAAMPTAAEDAALNAAPALAVRATQDAWIQVRGATGNVVFSHLLHAGDVWPVPPGPALAMTTGNAGGTELVTDGVASPPLGAPGAVLRDVPLSPPAAPPSP